MSLAICMDSDYTAVKLDTSTDQIIGAIRYDEKSKVTYYRHECVKEGENPIGLYYHITDNEEGSIFEKDYDVEFLIHRLESNSSFTDDERLLDLVISDVNDKQIKCDQGDDLFGNY